MPEPSELISFPTPGRHGLRGEALTRSLIAAGADISESYVYYVFGAGYTDIPLLVVARQGTPAVASLLLDAGADVNAEDPFEPGAGVLYSSSFNVIGFSPNNPAGDLHLIGALVSLFIAS